MLAVDDQRRLVEDRVAVVVHPACAVRPDVVTRGRDELHRAPALCLRNLRVVLGEAEHHGHARRVVGRALEVGVVVGDDEDVFVGRAGQLPHTLASRRPGRISVVTCTCAWTGPCSINCWNAFMSSVPTENVGSCPSGTHRRAQVARNRQIDDHRRRALGGGALEPTVPSGGVPHDTRRRVALDDDELSLDVLSEEVGLGAQADPDDVEVESALGRGARIRVPPAAVVNFNVFPPPLALRSIAVRKPLRRKVEVLAPDVRCRPNSLNLPSTSASHHVVVLRAGDPAPHQVAGVTALDARWR